MSAPDYYETYLLGKAREECRSYRGRADLTIRPDDTVVVAWEKRTAEYPALTALLDDLGVDVEPRPSAEDVREARERLVVTDTEGVMGEWVDVAAWRNLYASGDRGRLLASAVIAGGKGA